MWLVSPLPFKKKKVTIPLLLCSQITFPIFKWLQWHGIKIFLMMNMSLCV